MRGQNASGLCYSEGHARPESERFDERPLVWRSWSWLPAPRSPTRFAGRRVRAGSV